MYVLNAGRENGSLNFECCITPFSTCSVIDSTDSIAIIYIQCIDLTREVWETNLAHRGVGWVGDSAVVFILL